MTRADKLKSYIYAMYMMVDSYFENLICETPVALEKCQLQYAEIPVDRQVNNEILAEKMLEREVLKKLPKVLLKEKVKMKLVIGDESHWELRLRNDNYIVRLFLYNESVAGRGERIGIRSEILYNRENLEKHYRIQRKAGRNDLPDVA